MIRATLARTLVVSLLVLVSSPALAGSADIPPDPEADALTHRVRRASSQIAVDGALDERAWRDALRVELDYEVRPGENVPPPVRTVCYVTYDESNVYFGFHAFDPNPDQIRARYTDRDAAWNDDFVGIVLDTFNDQRRAYELFSTPLGVQIDAINDDVGGNYDDSWNAIWRSAGRIVDDGYEVEMAIPFHQIRFQKVDGTQVWGFDAIRSYPRNDRHQIGLFPRDRGANSYLSQTVKLVGMDGASPGKNFELIPTLTATRSDARASLPNGPYDEGDVESDLGASLRWGLTPNVSLNGAVHPDFSQVEADVLQLDVNEQFALFFRETRPFFLEGADYFHSPLDLVHTRTVADPSVAAKLTAKQGRHTWAVFTARDDVTNLIVPGAESSAGANFTFANQSSVGRYRYDFGKNSTVGGTLTDRRGDGYTNTVASVDTVFRIDAENMIRASLARSSTEYNDEIVAALGVAADRLEDDAALLSYTHVERGWWIELYHEDFGVDFRNDTGFRPRVDYRGNWLGGARVWWPENHFFDRAALGAAAQVTDRQNGELQRRMVEGWFNFQGPRESRVSIWNTVGKHGFGGIEFDVWRTSWELSVQAGADVSLELVTEFGDWIDFAHLRPADRTIVQPRLQYRLGRHLFLDLRHTYQQLDVAGGRLFRVHAPEVRAVHQFNTRTFVRLILQYTDIERDPALYTATVDRTTETLLTQALFTYKINPQTAVYAGYSDNQLGTDSFDLVRTDRTLFVKVGYAWVR